MEIFIFGILFGLIISYANLNKFNTISGLSVLKDYSVAKSILVAIGLGIILLNIEIEFGFASYHIKPLIFGGLTIGGLLFGAGMSILGYCPGTLAVSLGEGSIDALIGIIGGLFGGFVFTLLLPYINYILGPNIGNVSVNTLIKSKLFFNLVFIIIGLVFIWLSFFLHKKEKIKKDYKWLISGIALAILNIIVFLSSTTNRPIGASTSYPYLSDFLTGFTKNSYFIKIEKPGNWELIFLFGALLSGLILSIIKKEFKFKLIHKNWEFYKGSSKLKRIIWSFIGGFILIFGARMAGGCTSGHILSGGMQLAVSSLIFAVFVFIGLLFTGKIFYKK